MTLTDRNSSNKQHEGRITITHHNTLDMGGSSEETVEYFSFGLTYYDRKIFLFLRVIINHKFLRVTFFCCCGYPMLIFPTDLQKSSIFNMREGKQSL
jgi:hypothetical protein